jgi:hypothetical protein
MRHPPHAAPAGGGVHPAARCARFAAAWLLLLAAAGAVHAQTTAAQMAQMAGLTPQERSLYLLKAAVNGETVKAEKSLLAHCKLQRPRVQARQSGPLA